MPSRRLTAAEKKAKAEQEKQVQDASSSEDESEDKATKGLPEVVNVQDNNAGFTTPSSTATFNTASASTLNSVKVNLAPKPKESPFAAARRASKQTASSSTKKAKKVAHYNVIIVNPGFVGAHTGMMIKVDGYYTKCMTQAFYDKYNQANVDYVETLGCVDHVFCPYVDGQEEKEFSDKDGKWYPRKSIVFIFPPGFDIMTAEQAYEFFDETIHPAVLNMGDEIYRKPTPHPTTGYTVVDNWSEVVGTGTHLMFLIRKEFMAEGNRSIPTWMQKPENLYSIFKKGTISKDICSKYKLKSATLTDMRDKERCFLNLSGSENDGAGNDDRYSK